MKQKLKLLAGTCATSLLIFINSIQIAWAGKISSWKGFTGTEQLLKDMRPKIIAISGLLGTVVIAFCLVRMKMADEMDVILSILVDTFFTRILILKPQSPEIHNTSAA